MRGRVDIWLGGASYQMRPAYDAMRQIEARTKLTMQELLELVQLQRLRIEEAVLVIWYACNASGDQFDDIEQLGVVVFEERITSERLRSSLAQFLLSCLYSPEVAQKKWDAEVGQIIAPSETG